MFGPLLASRWRRDVPEFLEATIDKFIFRVAGDRLYSREGVWTLEEGDRVRLGLTDYRQQLNGDVAFVHLKPVGTVLVAGEAFAEVETIKANVSLHSPVAGRIVEVNGRLDLSPETINQEPYAAGWLAVVVPHDWRRDRSALLDPSAYLEAMKAQAEEELSK